MSSTSLNIDLPIMLIYFTCWLRVRAPTNPANWTGPRTLGQSGTGMVFWVNYDFLNSSNHAPRVLLLGPFLTPAEIRCVFDGNKTFETVRNCFKPVGNHSKHVETIHTILINTQLRPPADTAASSSSVGACGAARFLGWSGAIHG